MFGSKVKIHKEDAVTIHIPATNSSIEAGAETPSRPQPLPIDLQNEFDEEFKKEYTRLAEKLNIPKIVLNKFREEEILKTLAELGIELFDTKEVESYMNKTFVRIATSSDEYNYGYKVGSKITNWSYWPLTASQSHTAPYTKPIPLPILQLVEKIKDRIPGAVFHVMAEGQSVVPNPDPFLAFTCDGASHFFIFAMWDEPGFIAKEKK